MRIDVLVTSLQLISLSNSSEQKDAVLPPSMNAYVEINEPSSFLTLTGSIDILVLSLLLVLTFFALILCSAFIAITSVPSLLEAGGDESRTLPISEELSVIFLF